MGQFSDDFTIRVAFAYFIFSAILALPIALVITLALIRRFRRRVGRSMRAAAAAIEPKADLPSPGTPAGGLVLERIDAMRIGVAARAQPAVARIRRRMRELAALYAASASAYPLLLAAAIVVTPRQAGGLLPLALPYATRVLELGVPVALAPTVVINRRPRYLALSVIVLAALVWAWTASTASGTLQVLVVAAGVPTVAILLLNIRRLRAVGPVVFAASLAVVYGFMAGLAYATLFVAEVTGPWTFVRDDLAGLEFDAAAGRYLIELASLPLDRIIDELSRVAADPDSLLHADHRQALTARLWLAFFAIWLTLTAAGAAAAWAIVCWLARSYQLRRASDQMLTVDVIMLILGLSLFVTFCMSNWLYAAGALAGLAGYGLLSRRLLDRRRQAAPAPRPLLLLRVFGFDRRTQQLLDDLGRRWRYLGPIRLIGGTDLAYATIEPHEFFEFLNGRLSRAFIKDADDLASRLAAEAPAPDPDGLYRVEDFFCHDDTWRMTVARLARDASAVLMDLRGFSPANRGCILEIEELISGVPIDRVVLLVDRSTDLPFLEQTVTDAWREMAGDSPNRVSGQHRLRLLQASTRDRRTLAALLGLLCEDPAGPVAPRTAGSRAGVVAT